MHTKNKNGTAHGLLFLRQFLPFSCNYKQKTTIKSLYRACSHPTQHNYQTSCLLRSIISTIHPDKIKPYSQLCVSMTSLTNFSTLVPIHPDLFFLSLIGYQAMMTKFSTPPIGHQAAEASFPTLSLVIKTHGSL